MPRHITCMISVISLEESCLAQPARGLTLVQANNMIWEILFYISELLFLSVKNKDFPISSVYFMTSLDYWILRIDCYVWYTKRKELGTWILVLALFTLLDVHDFGEVSNEQKVILLKMKQSLDDFRRSFLHWNPTF